jgi:predicted PurR-regulated permease PerM
MKTENWDPIFRYIVFVVVVIFLVALGWTIRALFKPLITAALLSWILSPIVKWLSASTRLSRKAAGNIVYFTALAVLIAAPFFLVPVLIDELQNVLTALNTALDQLKLLLAEPVSIGPLHLQLGTWLPAFQQTFSETLRPLPEDILRLVESTSLGAAWFLVIVVSTYYLMTDWERAYHWMINLAPETYQPEIERLYRDIKEVWMAYLRGQIVLMIIVAIVFSLIWAAIGLPGALLIGILTGLFSLVPEIGPLTATLIAVVVALLEGSTYLPLSNFWFAVLVVAIYAVLINFKNIWLRPYIMGRSVNINEGVIFVAILAAVVFQGVLGALIIVPVLASFIIIGRYLRRRLFGLPPFSNQPGEDLLSEAPAPPQRRKMKPAQKG